MADLKTFLKRAGWKHRGDAWSASGRHYRVVEEAAPGSWDRSVAPFLAKAIMVARAAAGPAMEPLAVLKVKRATPLTDERLSEFIREVAPDQGWILVDDEGRIFPHVKSAPELTQLAAKTPLPVAARLVSTKPQSLFTDLNQWMLKVLLAAELPEKYLNVPRGRPLRNASTLAEAAGVSLPAAARFLRALEAEGHLDTRFGDLRIARPLELLKVWRDRLGHPATRELAAASVHGQFNAGLMVSVAFTMEAARKAPPQIVLSLHSACEELGLGHVKGDVPVLWTRTLDAKTLEGMGLVAVTSDQKFDAVLRVPRFPESVFRGAVVTTRRPATDVIQCWLDESHYRIRGQEQASVLWRNVLEPAFKR